jgi:hypothetical protein
MKNTLIALAFIAIGAASTHAQTSNRYDWGIEGGPNLNTFRMSANPFFDPKPLVAGSGGFIFQYNTKKILSFKTGFSFQRKGYQIKDLYFTDNMGNYIGSGKMVVTLDYITLPLLVKASFGKKTQFFINAGPYAGFLLNEKSRAFNGNKVVDEDNITGDANRFDFGVTGGIGIAVPIKESWRIHAEVRNYFGLTNLDESAFSDVYTNTTDLRVGVVYRLGFRE